VSDDQILEVRLFDLTGRQVLCDASYFGNSVVVSTNNHASGFLFAEIRTVSAVKTLRLTQVK
jgi:hypothetical protein